MRARYFVLQLFLVGFTSLSVCASNPGEGPADSPAALTKWLERRWPLDAIRKFCIAERRHDIAYQNLVTAGEKTWEGQLYASKKTGFDKIFWYATIESGRLQEYSLNASRGNDFWLLEIVDREHMSHPPIVEPDPSHPGFVGHK